MPRRRIAELAVDRMTMEALWARVSRELDWFEQYGIRGAEFRERKAHLESLDACCGQLALRGLQLTMGHIELMAAVDAVRD